MGKETVLPKNIRQIGDIQGKDKICIEDYVMTYIRKKEPQEDKGFLGIFLGEKKETEENCYIFIRGILELAQEEAAEAVKEQFEKQRLEYFPGWEVMGCCVIGTYPTKRMEQLSEAAPVARQLIYHYQEQEENLYLMTEEKYRKIGGYLVFYEQNRKMQDYLAEVFGRESVEKESLPDKAIKSFRDKVKDKSEQKSRSVLKLAGSFFVVTVLAIGAVVVNRVDDLGFSGSTDVSNESTAAVSRSTDASNESTAAVSQSTDTANQSDAAAETAASASDSNGSETWLNGSDAFWEESEAEEADSSNVQEESDASGTDQSASENESSEAASRQTQAAYVIKEGDTLAMICKKYYGNMERLDEICEVNDIADANMILPGQKIVLP